VYFLIFFEGKMYTEDTDPGAGGGSTAAAAAAAATAPPKPIRKPDPSLRELQRQISFGSGSGVVFGSIKRKAMQTAQLSTEAVNPPPVVAEEASTASALLKYIISIYLE
jgi:mevalonate pyrophosphate decarboxylase